MRKVASFRQLETFGRERLSANFFMRDFLFSEIAAITGVSNLPDDPDLAIASGKRLCTELLEPLNATFGRVAVRSSFRSGTLNRYGNENGLPCARNQLNYADHIWDHRDEAGRMGATACVVIPWFADRYEQGADWRSLAWWVHDHLPYSSLYFFPKRAAFNLQWREQPVRRIDSYIAPKGCLTKPGMQNHAGDHAQWYAGFPPFKPGNCL